jgi:hypothetical protein
VSGSMSGQAIYDNFVNHSGPGMAELSNSVIGTMRLSASYQDRAALMKSLAAGMEAAWQGDAAGAARRGAGPLAVEHEVAAPQIGDAAISMAQQAAAFETARNSVVPVPDMPEKPGPWDNLISAGQANVFYERKLLAINAANEHNIAVMRAYEDATRQNQAMLTGIPQVLNPTNPGNGGEQLQQPGSPGPRPMPGRIPVAGGGGSTGGGGGAAAGSQSAAQWSAPQASATGHTGLGETHPDFAQPLPRPSGPADAGLPKPIPQSQPSAGPGPGSLPVGGLGPVGGSGSGVDPRRAGGPGGARGPGGPGGSGGPGGPGADGGRSGGLGARGLAGIDSAGRGAAGAAGRGGPGGAPGGAGARSQNDEDSEHWRPSFLVEPDPDETFGTDEVTAPPVIGE